MAERPELNRQLSAERFMSYYYLKEELVSFCRQNGLPTSGGKLELTQRIAEFLDTGIIPQAEKSCARKSRPADDVLTEQSVIEKGFVCSEKHRAFFSERIGKGFSFNVAFQKWLRSNAGKTYADAIEAYRRIINEKKSRKTTIDRQFEYNTYIRDFFADNKGSSLEAAIKCWKYKKSIQGHNRYERSDLKALENAKGE